MRTIASIRNKDPKIYDQKTKWYHSDDEIDEGEENQVKKSKKQTYKDVLREQLLRGEVGEDEEISNSRSKKSTFQYDAEQEELRKQFLHSANGIVPDSDVSSDDDLLIEKKKDPSIVAQEEEELKQTLQSLVESNNNPTEDDLFLVNYMKQKRWIDPLSKSLKATAGTGGEASHMTEAQENELLDLEEDEQELYEIDKFESKYNFRFEELQNGLIDLSPLSFFDRDEYRHLGNHCRWS
jgi:protein KRI1